MTASHFVTLGPALLAAYALLSAVTLAAYAVDKSAARRGSRRVPESTLHMLSLLGGWPGALLAMRTLRHKTVKHPFRRVFWVTVAVNCVVLAGAVRWLASSG